MAESTTLELKKCQKEAKAQEQKKKEYNENV
jgi:hypothetical protein